MEPQSEAEKAIVPVGSTSIVRPVVDVEQVLAAVKAFKEIKQKVLDKKKDFIYIGTDGKPNTQGRGEPYIKKSGWRTVALAFNLSISVGIGRKEWYEDSHGTYYVWRYPITVAANNGRSVSSEGICSSRNKFFALRKQKDGSYKYIEPYEPDIMLTAQTVGINRAISDMVGSGEVSGEEMLDTAPPHTQTDIKDIVPEYEDVHQDEVYSDSDATVSCDCKPSSYQTPVGDLKYCRNHGIQLWPRCSGFCGKHEACLKCPGYDECMRKTPQGMTGDYLRKEATDSKDSKYTCVHGDEFADGEKPQHFGECNFNKKECKECPIGKECKVHREAKKESQKAKDKNPQFVSRKDLKGETHLDKLHTLSTWASTNVEGDLTFPDHYEQLNLIVTETCDDPANPTEDEAERIIKRFYS